MRILEIYMKHLEFTQQKSDTKAINIKHAAPIEVDIFYGTSISRRNKFTPLDAMPF